VLSATLTPTSSSYASSNATNDTITVAAAASSITVGSFAPESFSISKTMRVEIGRVATSIASRRLRVIDVVGYTDATGNAGTNQFVSMQRAKVVAAVLERDLRRLHFGPIHIVASGHGDDDPVASNATLVGQSRNRRVVISSR
jgi:outer membrane protein OmpA-like peptidoglycan-associated protein